MRLVVLRLLQALPVLLVILCGLFALLKAAPGDAVDVLMAETGGGDAELVARLRADYGLDRPWPAQLGAYLARTVTGDLGYSFGFARPVRELVLDRLGNTILLMATGICFAAGIGILAGIAAARREGSLADRAIGIAALILYATPGFWLGLMLIVLFTVKLGWLPSGGIETIGGAGEGMARLLDIARHLVMPVLALSLTYAALYQRLMRAGILQVARAEFVRTARAKGLPERRILWRHIVRNALLPVVTMLGLQFGTLLGGSVVVESVFAIPGLGRLAFEAVMKRDLPLLLGIILVGAVLVVLVNLAVDLAYGRLDPRIRR